MKKTILSVFTAILILITLGLVKSFVIKKLVSGEEEDAKTKS